MQYECSLAQHLSAGSPVEVFNDNMSLLVEGYLGLQVIRVHNKDRPWFYYQCRCAFDLKQEAHLQLTRVRSRVNWEEFVRC